MSCAGLSYLIENPSAPWAIGRDKRGSHRENKPHDMGETEERVPRKVRRRPRGNQDCRLLDSCRRRTEPRLRAEIKKREETGTCLSRPTRLKNGLVGRGEKNGNQSVMVTKHGAIVRGSGLPAKLGAGDLGRRPLKKLKGRGKNHLGQHRAKKTGVIETNRCAPASEGGATGRRIPGR